MKTKGRITGLSRNLDGDLQITLSVDDHALDEVEGLKDMELSIDIDAYRKQRSLNANAYLWALCTEIAKKVGSDKDSIYLLMLSRYGTYELLDVLECAVHIIRPLFRIIEEDHQYYLTSETIYGDEERKMCCLRCYKGSHEYNSKEMSDLLNGVVSECFELGIPTLENGKIESLINNWRGR